MKALAGMVAAACLLAAAPDNSDEANKQDLERLQGTWVVESAQSGGKDVAVDKLTIQGMIFEGDTFTIIENGKPTKTGSFKLDASMKPPTIDLAGKDGKMVKQGVYQFDGDALKMAFVVGDEGRPSGLVSKEGSSVVVLTLKRQKK